ncbi:MULTISPECIES: DUF4333 domain-containing protein [unclassified Mycolicibacterium]|uniref:DUF4333 domain-containing protein n=1 Tax=unclassified Mycolicibacterium TaxID=2636767 RepID=UPI0012DE71D7|nr:MULTISPECIES: DUF4333 domain-containing protein [unclassified Mycolicibacterium]MUL84549.1 DUF4333 domain-containing protein [Mycolicibacterium sp. CBMA 329]MUL88324.1 DUF4333 domain-containing protein [Mycolicibacterium sp. CBMA 331]MUL99227.1 DUF4333 domain-containing protein [Mycolicibacterium sp. CBMA 334]MUM27569.1 DUF4333 domain-containing protein [Mycolicibacterium sp. CBMA 295]MUM39971.1 DUF4333 domain-containing protein [Mycolicibacterium sp. CBMA 247]
MRDVKSKLHVLVATAVVSGAVLAGCGGGEPAGTQPTVAKTKLQTLAKEKLEAAAKRTAKSVTCDDGIVGKVGATQHCVLTAKDGTKYGVTATVRAVESNNVNIDFKVDDKPTS